MKASPFSRRLSPCTQRAGFTLVELLVVIAIVAVLALLSFALLRTATAKAHSATCLGILRQFGVATASYLGDNNNKFPVINVNLQKPNYMNENGSHIFAKIYPYLGLETQTKLTALPDSLVCPSFRKRFPGWNANGTGEAAGNAYFLNQDQQIGGKRIFGTQGSQLPAYGGMSYALVVDGTGQTPLPSILYLADGHHPTENHDPVHGNRRNCLFLDFHAESLPVEKAELFISP